MNELLTCEGLTKSYQKGTNALDDIELHIGFGRIVGLLGPNGSGKTTLIKLANGLLQPTAGSIKIAGMDPGPDTKAIVSYLPDAAWLPDWMRVEQLVEMFRDFYADFDPAKANEMLEKLELLSDRQHGGSAEYFVTNNTEAFDSVAKVFLGEEARVKSILKDIGD